MNKSDLSGFNVKEEDTKVNIRDTSAQDRVVAKKGKGKTLLWIMVGVFVAAVGIYWFAVNWRTDISLSKADLRTAVVERRDFERDLNVTGRIIAANAPTLYSQAAGQIKLLKQPGEQVVEGEVVAVVSSPQLQNRLQQEEALLQRETLALTRLKLSGEQQELELKKAVDTAQVMYLAAKRELNRAENSIKLKVISTFDFEKAKDDLLTAQLELENARKDKEIKLKIIAFENETKKFEVSRQQLVVDDLKRKQKGLELQAPVTGMMGNWLVNQDSSVSENEALLVVVDLSQFDAELSIPQSFAAELTTGLKVDLTVGTVSMDGFLESVSPEVNGNSVSARVQLNLPENTNIRQNQYVSATIVLEKKIDVLTVKRGQFVQTSDVVFVVEADKAVRQPVTLGSRNSNRIEILSGLSEGDEIIISSVAQFSEKKSIDID